jgi:hypothetical protein
MLRPLKPILEIINGFFKTDAKILLGRWHLNDCNLRVNKKVDNANVDHCGPCGQYDQELLTPSNKKKIIIDEEFDIPQKKLIK